MYGFSLTLSDKLKDLLKILKEQIKVDIKINIILIHDGVIGISQEAKAPEYLADLLNLPVNIFAVIPDLKARGIDPKNIIKEIKGIEYDNLVDLLVDTQKIVSWM
jgi:sulfur relay protein TusB/DsrH